MCCFSSLVFCVHISWNSFLVVVIGLCAPWVVVVPFVVVGFLDDSGLIRVVSDVNGYQEEIFDATYSVSVGIEGYEPVEGNAVEGVV